MTKATPITAHSEQADLLRAALHDVTPPDHVRMEERDMPFFRSVIAEFARADWSDHQVELACLLARAMSDVEHEQVMLRKEGAIVHNKNGTPMVNHRKTVIQMYSSSILQLRRSLCLDARSTGRGTDLAKKRKLKKEIEADMVGAMKDDDAEDGLIARPLVN